VAKRLREARGARRRRGPLKEPARRLDESPPPQLAGTYAASQERERFLREAEAVAGPPHGNIVQVYGAFANVAGMVGPVAEVQCERAGLVVSESS
jgi:hypothetical protein